LERETGIEPATLSLGNLLANRPVKLQIEPREHDAQKALRRTYICSALMADRNPKLVAAELGHATARMVTDQYDSFMDPANWPDHREIETLRATYGWPEQGKQGTSDVARR